MKADQSEEFAASAPLYHRVMGDRFTSLPAAVREMHAVWRDGSAEGDAEVQGPESWIGKRIALAMGLPPEGRMPVYVAFAARDGVERWTRTFGEHTFSSELSQKGRYLVERFGPLQFTFSLPSDQQGLRMVMTGWHLWKVPLPLMLAPHTLAREWEADGRFHFDVQIALPLAGRLVHYRGWLRPICH